MRKLHAESVAGFAGSAMSDGVGKDDEVLSGVEWLTGPKEDAFLMIISENNAINIQAACHRHSRLSLSAS
jgi:hypothetical protein